MRLSLIIVLILLTGCGNLNRRRDCQKLGNITTVLAENTLPMLEEKNQEIISLSSQYFIDTSQQIKSANWQDLTIQEYGNNLSEIYNNYGNLTQEFLSALRRKEREKAFNIQTELQQLTIEQTAIVEKINSYCQGKL